MYADRTKPKMDFSLCLGCIPAMLRVCEPVLSPQKYNEMRKKVEKEKAYTKQKKIFFDYVDPVIKG